MACPTCGDQSASRTPGQRGGDWARFDCPRCGVFELTGTAEAATGDWRFSSEQVPWVPYNMRLSQQSGSIPRMGTDDLVSIKKNLRRPTPSEAADNLIRRLGANLEFGRFVNIGTERSLAYVIGATASKGVRYLAEELEKSGLVNIDRTSPAAENPENLFVDLSFSGWERFEALKRGAHRGRFAFMAMAFGQNELTEMVNNCFRKAVSATGFELRLLNDHEHQRAGLIDDRLRVELEGARFLVVDLTYENGGAYWEAGYGEGLGKPVIYTCKKIVFEERRKTGGGTHFDTNHHLHILWGEGDLDSVASELKACIRATIPEASRE
jgi:hypothetical protein